MDTASSAIHDLETVETRQSAVREATSTRGEIRISPHRRRAVRSARGDWRIVPPCILRCPLRTSTLLVFHDCLVLYRDPLNRRMRTRMSGGVAGCVKKMRKHHAVREIEGRPLGAVL